MDETKKIIKFKKCEISESEINALFLGLIKLIKRKAEDGISLSLKRECAFATERNLYLEEKLREREKEISVLKEINKELNRNIQKLKKHKK